MSGSNGFPFAWGEGLAPLFVAIHALAMMPTDVAVDGADFEMAFLNAALVCCLEAHRTVKG